MEILIDSNVGWEKPGDTISHGYITVRLRSKPSYRLREQGLVPDDGIFDIEKEYITVFPPRCENIPIPRSVRRRKLQKEFCGIKEGQQEQS